MIAATAYLEKYFDCVEALPLDLQRHVTQLREIDRKTQDLLTEARRLQRELVECEGGREEEGKRCLARIQTCLLRFRECGNEKLEITSQLLDTVDDYTQQLALRGKDLDNPRSAYDHPSPRYTHPPTHSTKGESTLATVTDGATEKIPSKRNSSTKRPRPSEKSHHHPPHPHPSPAQGGGEEEGGVREGGGGRSRENSTTSSTGGTPGNGKPPKKKIKIKKKTTTASVTKDTSVFLPPSGQVPMPDLTSQPLDPDEPTYCFCNQVSFGEMIGCDNEECPIEWFHFQCVGLTSKPKGKWYCSRCSQERKGRNTK